MPHYNPKDIEPKWQQIWDETGTYTANLQSGKPKYIAMSMFNYPSGAGIHIGHAMNYTISDVKARFKRQQGFESYHPVGWDAFGLPAENYAIKAGVSPQESMATIIPDYHKQYKAMGWSNDWEKEISTHLPEYYKWTQWIFAQMYKHGLAYQDTRMQWWCTIDNSVLANEQVIDGKCWRHDGPDDPLVEKKEVKQWFFKITDYADELLEAIDSLDWTDSVKLAQKNWIGKSIGAEVTFVISTEAAGVVEKSQTRSLDSARDDSLSITVFTTRPDTIFGATFLVVAPESEIVKNIVTPGQKAEVEAYIKVSATKTEVERQASKEKTGVFTGAYAINPATEKEIPIWIADYVLAGYGTGAIMAVPAHDERDFEFAKQFNLSIEPVVANEFIDDISPIKPGLPLEERIAAQTIVKHPTEDKYLLLHLNGWQRDIYSLPMGGVDSGEDLAEAAGRELHEETGFTDHGDIIQFSAPYFAQFYHEFKKVNRRAKIYTFVTQLNSMMQNDIDEQEKAKHELLWVDIDDLIIKLHGQGVQRVTQAYRDGGAAITGEGTLINSGAYDGLSSTEAREKIVADLEKKGLVKKKVNYKMRDWSVSRQRYWGAPIPIINCPKDGPVLVPDEDLPVVLPELDDFEPNGDGRSALARATDWLVVDCPKCGGKAERETDTLDTYIDSSWYMYRYFDPHNQQAIFDSELVKKWEPVDFYNGGDHATAHLLYARFMARFFTKLGLINDPEPFKQFLFNGKVTASDGTAFSKSKGNGIDPLEIIGQGYGADALRTYLMFAAPLEFGARWDPKGVPGTFRFLNRLWNLVQEFHDSHPDRSGGISSDSKEISRQARDDNVLKATHQMIKKVTEDVEENRYNTAIAAMMGCLNELYKFKTEGFANREVWQQALESLVACVAPFAPHTAEELWQQLGHSTSVHIDTWPKFDEKYLTSDMMTIVVQVNGKLRAQLELPANSDKEAIIAVALADEKVIVQTTGKEIKKTIYVPGKLVNIVI